MDSFIKLSKAKTSLKGNITRIETFAEKVTKESTNVTELEVKIKKIDQLQIKLEELKSSCFDLEKISDEEITEFEADVEQCEERLEQLEVSLKILIKSYNECISSVTECDKKENINITKTQIPPIVLPTFSGKYELFSSFKSQFDDLITFNNQLSQSQKLYYLNSCLSNEVKEFASTFDTFTSLYEALESRYDNKRLIIDVHVKSILNFKKIEHENAVEIRAMIDCIQKNLRALKVLKYEQNELFDVFLQTIMLNKLDKESRKHFELLQKTKDVPTFEQFTAFLEQREAVLLSVERNCNSETKPKKPPIFSSKTKTLLVNENNENKNCIICSKYHSHPIFRCEKFLELTPQKRFELVRLHKLCELCLRKNHKKYECKSSYLCRCGEKHSQTICFNQTNRKAPMVADSSRSLVDHSETKNKNKQASVESNSILHSTILSNKFNKNKSILLSTGIIYLQKSDGSLVKCNAIFDSASNVNILSRKMIDFLGIKIDKIKSEVSGLNSMKQNLKGKLRTFISNQSGSFKEPIEFIITDKITGLTPSVNLDISKIKIPDFLELADPSFSEAKEIHALLNADIFFRIMKDNIYKINKDLLFRETEFGWIAGGRLDETKIHSNNSCFLLKNDSLIDDNLKRFFDLESLGIKDDPCFHEEDQAMKIFEQTIQYKNERYTVELPFRKDWKELSNNLPVAKQRIFNLWRRFKKNNELYYQYQEIIADYLNQGIIEKVENPEINSNKPVYYLPHQAVRKEGRVTSSTRIVFDAGSHQVNELSLNDCLWPGPNLNPNLLDVLINFRLNRIAIVSDIRQAFLQICLADKHKDAVRFLWTDSNPDVDIKPSLQIYHFNTVLFGVNASPFLLAATVKHHIEKYRDDFPTTVHHLDSFMYVDDWITGQDTPEEAHTISCSAKKIMKEAGMEMRKWISNDSSLMRRWAEEGFDIHPVTTSISLGTNNTKVLGLSWQTQDDCLALETKGLLEFISTSENTKRVILQSIGKIFDPLGLLTPFTMRMKCLIQELWQKKVPWDEDLPPNILEKWLAWCKELPLLNELRIPRLALDSSSAENSDSIQIHIFSDASKLAYGTSVYIRVKKQDKILVNLLTSKSRVAPLKNITLPRLELMGALLAARLSSKVQEIIGQKKHFDVFHWTDSKIVLFWIRGSSKRWKNFVANRVQEISKLTAPNTWHHCPGKDNPSDFLTRGLSAEQLLHNDKWWNGPSFLTSDEINKLVSEYPVPKEDEYLNELKSKNSNHNVVMTLKINSDFFDNLVNLSNRFLTLIRIVSFIFRFIHNLKEPYNKKLGPLTSNELTISENYIVSQLQKKEFSGELAALKNGGKVSHKSKIFNLSPFLDSNDIIRVGGRLQNSNLSYSIKHPMLLPSRCKLTEIIVRYYHEKFFHLGPQNLLFHVRQKYWPIHGRNLCKKIVHNCIVCFKANPQECFQKMGNLPKQRITPDKIFSSTGIDLCGPFIIRNKNQRKSPDIKIYVGIFICLVTKAIHIELITDLTSQALIAALKRFISRRGKCNKIFSDNGTNMVGACRELNILYKLVRDQEESLFAFFAEENIEWVFIPPRSPNWGGLWEANIKAFKYHFKRVAGNSKFTFEEMLTLVTQVEAILNSRPLIPLSADIEDLEILTPAHFLIGRPITAIVEPSLVDIEPNRLNAWQRITKSVQAIWKKWSLSYLNNLQQRGKWVIEKENLKIGDMVLVREENLPPCKWLLGRVITLYPGQDNKVRLVDIKTSKGIYKRSISRLSVLPIEK